MTRHARRSLAVAVVSVLLFGAPSAEAPVDLAKRMVASATVLTEIRATPDRDVPRALWNTASCVIVVPGLKKAAFVFGGEYGKGLMSCRTGSGWSAPVSMRIEKGSWGAQIGAQSIDLVLIVMNDKGVQKLLGNKVTLGAEASVAAGPVGRDARAATDVQMQAEILSYSRTQGLFAGINLSGGSLRPDTDDNAAVYGAGVTPRDVLLGGRVAAPSAARPFLDALRTH
jgi:lipid-binding SYLF domain-containing protein